MELVGFYFYITIISDKLNQWEWKTVSNPEFFNRISWHGVCHYRKS